MNIYLIRHAQSLWQTNESTSKDSNITKIGVIQSEYLNQYIKAKLLENINNYIIYVSPLQRAVQTIYSLNEKYILNNLIKEAIFHVSETLPKFSKPGLYSRQFSKEESYKKFRQETQQLLNQLILQKEYENLYLYTHAGVIKTILRILHDNDNICYEVDNCSITKIVWKRSRWYISYLNNTSFIPDKYRT